MIEIQILAEFLFLQIFLHLSVQQTCVHSGWSNPDKISLAIFLPWRTPPFVQDTPCRWHDTCVISTFLEQNPAFSVEFFWKVVSLTHALCQWHNRIWVLTAGFRIFRYLNPLNPSVSTQFQAEFDSKDLYPRLISGFNSGSHYVCLLFVLLTNSDTFFLKKSASSCANFQPHPTLTRHPPTSCILGTLPANCLQMKKKKSSADRSVSPRETNSWGGQFRRRVWVC